MATSLKAFQQEISTISESKKAQHLRELKQAQQAALEHQHGHKGGKGSGAGSGAGKGKENAVAGGKEKEKEKEGKKVEAGADGEGAVPEIVPEVSIEEILSQPYTPSSDSDSADPLLTHLAHHLLGSHHRELIIHLGAHPTAGVLFGTSGSSGEKQKEEVAGSAGAGAGEGKKEKTTISASNPSNAKTIGTPITQDQLTASLTRLKSACTTLHAELTQLYLHEPASISTSDGQGLYGRWLVRLIPNKAEEIIEVRVAVVGNVDSGKSTLTGVLTRGGLDDGRGKTRVALFRHKHEMETGRTSSVGLEILGFSPSGAPVVPTGHAAGAGDTTTGSTVAKREKIAWDEVCSKAAKVVSFIDLAGHERYLKTTLFGLTGCSPDYVMLIVGGNAGLIGMSKEHLGVSLALQVPIIICVTKIDMTPAHVLEQTIKQLVKVLKSPGCRKTPVFVESMQQAIDCATHLGTERICPIFLLSNVTGSGLDNLRGLLNCLPSSEGGKKYVTDAPLEFSISDVFSVPFAGSVASGLITSGTVKTGDNVLLGPDSVGQFIPTTIKSIQRKRVDVDAAEAGQSVSFALKKIRRAQLRKGMVILARQDPPPKAVRRFEAQMLVLNHSTTIANRFQAMCHINSVRQTVRIVSIDHPSGVLRTGDRAKVIFEFIQQPEFISSGSTLFVREARCRLLGVVTGVIKKEGEEAKGVKHGPGHGHGHGHNHAHAHPAHAHPVHAQAA